MNDERSHPDNLIDTTDCLEAIGVFRAWKNFLFVIMVTGLLLLQASFWLINTGIVAADTDDDTKTTIEVVEERTKIEEAAKQVTSQETQQEQTEKIEQAEQTESQEPQKTLTKKLFSIKFKCLTRLIRIVDYILIPVAILYSLTLIFSLKISLTGRLGGINHIARAFFLSLLVLVLLLPWQRFFAGITVGAIYSPTELINAHQKAQSAPIFKLFLYYMRFVGLWLATLNFLIFSQIRSTRWAKAILRRLEVI